MIEIATYIAPLLMGVAGGLVTGLIPGLHTNTVCAILLVFVASGAIDAPVMHMSIFIVAMAVTNSFFDVFPSLFLGIPDNESYSLLPGHRMVKDGKGLEALGISASGSLQGFIFMLLVCLGLVLLEKQMGGGTISAFEKGLGNHMFWILMGFSAFLVFTDKNKMMSLFVFLFCGFLGIMILGTPLVPSSSLSAFSGIFPALTGLFGMSGLVLSLLEEDSSLPPQDMTIKSKPFERVGPSIMGSLGGCVTGFLPGLGGANAATILLTIQDGFAKFKEKVLHIASKKAGATENGKDFLVATSAISTADSAFAIMTLYFIEKSRSGASIAVGELLPEVGLKEALTLMAAMGVSSLVAFLLIHASKRRVVRIFSKLSYKGLTWGVIIFLLYVTWATTGLWGLFILALCTLAGIIPYVYNVRKGQMMGFFMIPTMIFFSGEQSGVYEFLHTTSKVAVFPEMVPSSVWTTFTVAICLGLASYFVSSRLRPGNAGGNP